MKHSVFPGSRSGTVKIPASKSMAHRLLIAAALGKDSKILHFDGFSNDIGATIVCLRALGARVTADGKTLRVQPVTERARGAADCGESGATLRFLLPVAAALGKHTAFHLHGRLPQRPPWQRRYRHRMRRRGCR